MPAFGVVPNWQLPLHLLLGVVAGIVAPLFLMLLRGGEALFMRTNLPLIPCLGLGGLLVGFISIGQPGVWGNGYGMVELILNYKLGWGFLLTLLLLKVMATVATTGSGAVGGVFTPTLFCGAAIGALFGESLHAPCCRTQFFNRQLRRGRHGLLSRRHHPRADHVDPHHVRDDPQRRGAHAAHAGLHLLVPHRAADHARFRLQPAAARRAQPVRHAAVPPACARPDEAPARLA